MERMRFESPDLIESNIEKLGELFPSVLTETRDANGQLKKAVNFEALRQLLTPEALAGHEAYEFTWVGKKQAMAEAGRPVRKTLRPCPEESRDWDSTENLYIEGDNLDVLKLLQTSYAGKVRLIYIDPPYNTGNDFIYRDNYAMGRQAYDLRSGAIVHAAAGGALTQRLFTNTDANGRFHSDWCSMIYPRLMLARNLLSEDGVIFISCDDNEIHSLRNICNEIFGDDNFEGHIHWRRRPNQPNDKTKLIGIVAEHILVYARHSQFLKDQGVGKIAISGKFSNPDNDPRGPWASKPWKVGAGQGGCRYKITSPSGRVYDEVWMGDEATYRQLALDNRIVFTKSGDGLPRKKYYQQEREAEGQCASNWWDCAQFGHNQGANDCMTSLFGIKNLFSNPKPVELLAEIARLGSKSGDGIFMDFFSGSATLAHAVMQLNAEDGGRRQFIMVQLPEECPPDSEAAKAGYKTICEIGKERIRRAGEKIRQDNAGKPGIEDLDTGFRVLKCDSSNMKDVYYAPRDTRQNSLDALADNIREARSGLDLLFGCLIDLGLPLSLPCRTEEICGHAVHFYDWASGQSPGLAACLDASMGDEAIRQIASLKPRRAVFRDSAFATSARRINAGELFKTLSPDTVVKVL